MTFYAALIDLLGRCAPEMHVSFMFFIHWKVKTYLFYRLQVCNSFFSQVLDTGKDTSCYQVIKHGMAT